VDTIEKPLPKVICFMHSFACRDIQLWNSLPASVVNAQNVAVFKCLLDKVDFSQSQTAQLGSELKPTGVIWL